MKRAYEKLLVKVQTSCCKRLQHIGDASTKEVPPRTATAMEWNEPRPRTSCVCYRGWSGRMNQVLWSSAEDHNWIPDIRWLEFCFALI